MTKLILDSAARSDPEFVRLCWALTSGGDKIKQVPFCNGCTGTEAQCLDEKTFYTKTARRMC
eukprot:scaffold32314_cov112-Isochrysis_galbana.AAC.1